MSNSENVKEVEKTERAIPFRGALTVPDAYPAGSLSQPLGNRIAMWVVRGVFIVSFVYLSWITAYTYWCGEPNLARMYLTGALGVLLLICFGIGSEIWYRRIANQLCKDGKLLYAPTEGEIDADSIRSKSKDGEGTLKWSGFCGYRSNDSVVVLYFEPPTSFAIMARSKFSSDENWSAFKQLVSTKLNRI